jgi:7-carboxy-7-deazaguanine synthase
MSRLRIAEAFTSIQGEGLFAGTPSAFIRISGCHLRCVWCDTPYASWSPEGPLREVDELAGWFARQGVGHAVITGGEPMIFPQTAELAARLKELGAAVTIETAGAAWLEISCDLMSISPKLSNSDPGLESGPWRERHIETRSDRGPLARLLAGHDCQLKFVVNPEGPGDDLAEIEEMMAGMPPIAPERIFLMPEGIDSETLWRRARLLCPVIMERGWRLGPRLQIDLFGDTRGT